MSNISKHAIVYLDHQTKSTVIALSNAKKRSGVTAEEIMNLENKLAIIEWLHSLVESEVSKEE